MPKKQALAMRRSLTSKILRPLRRTRSPAFKMPVTISTIPVGAAEALGSGW